MHQRHGEGCDSRQLSCFPVPQAGALPAPRAFVPYPRRPEQQFQGTAAKPSLGEDLGPKPSSTLPSSTHVPSLASLPPRCTGGRQWDQHGKSRIIIPELVPVAQRANTPRALPLAAIPCAETAHPLLICFPAAGSWRPRAPSGCVYVDTQSRRAQVSDGEYLACCWEQPFPHNSTIALQDLTTPQHSSALERSTLPSCRTDFPFNSLRL